MDYRDWLHNVPDSLRADSLWKMTAYRVSLFLADIGWEDVTRLTKDRRTVSIADQLYRALCGISPNLAEGYSRGTGKDRARFYEYSLGSVRESRDWYFKSRHVLGQEVVNHRLDLLAHLARLLLTMVPQQRAGSIREERAVYDVKSEQSDDKTLETLLANVPFAQPE